MKKKVAKTTVTALLAAGMLLGGAGAAQAASQYIYAGNWEYGVSSTVNWTRFTPYQCPSLLKNLVLQNGGYVYRFHFYDDQAHSVSLKRHATQNYQGINW